METTATPRPLALLNELYRLQDNGEYNELNESILSLEAGSMQEKAVQDFFTLHLADSGFAQWLRENSCGYDEVI